MERGLMRALEIFLGKFYHRMLKFRIFRISTLSGNERIQILFSEISNLVTEGYGLQQWVFSCLRLMKNFAINPTQPRSHSNQVNQCTDMDSQRWLDFRHRLYCQLCLHGHHRPHHRCHLCCHHHHRRRLCCHHHHRRRPCRRHH